MQTTVQTVSGHTYTSDYFSRAQVESDLKRGQTFEDFLDSVQSVLTEWRTMDYLSLTINGRDRIFNPANIEWVDVDPEDR